MSKSTQTIDKHIVTVSPNAVNTKQSARHSYCPMKDHQEMVQVQLICPKKLLSNNYKSTFAHLRYLGKQYIEKGCTINLLPLRQPYKLWLSARISVWCVIKKKIMMYSCLWWAVRFVSIMAGKHFLHA